MPRENYQAKGARYIVEGRVTVDVVARAAVHARVKGTGEVYDVTATEWGWSCTCPARGPCAHLYAVQLVTVRPRTRTRTPRGAP